MNTLKLLAPLLIIYSMQAADPQDARKAADILKNKGKITAINQEITYYLDTTPTDYTTIESTLRYHEFFNGKKALSYEYKEKIDNTIRSTAIYDYKSGRIDGKPDIYIIINNKTSQKVETPDSTQKARYDKAIEEILNKHLQK